MKVSIVIPCYNAERYLGQTIGSALAQSRPPAEILVVDDGSTDASVAVARSFGSRIEVICKPNGGAAQARNYGAERARGDALMFLDADDVLGPAVLEGLTAALERQPDSIAVGPWSCIQLREGRWVRTRRNCKHRRFGYDDLSAWLTGWFHTPCSVLWSRAAYEQVGGWDERVTVDDDGDIMMRAMIEGVPLAKATFGEAYYRRLPAGETSLSDGRRTEAGLRSRIFVMDKLGDLLAQRGKLRTYGPLLAEAFDLIGDDCGDRYPALYAHCRDQARRYGGPSRIRRLRKATSVLSSKVARRGGALLRLEPEPPVAVPEDEIVFGLQEAVPPTPEATPAGQDRWGRDEPLVSVVIPVYNREALVARAIDSVLGQTFEDFEVLVVDDASTDGTPGVVRQYDDERVRYLRQKTNRGVSAARNRALREARGAFIAFLDSDDTWMPEKLELQVRRFQELPEDVGLLYTGVETVEGDGGGRIDRPAYRGDVYRELLTVNRIYTTSGVMIRAEAAETVGYFDEKAPANEDWDYWVRVARHFKVDYVEDVLMRYTAGSEHDRKSLALRDDLEARARFYVKYEPDMRRHRVAYPFLVESARRYLVPKTWDPAGARGMIWKAVRLRPAAPQAYVRLLRSLLPQRGYLLLRTAAREWGQYRLQRAT